MSLNPRDHGNGAIFISGNLSIALIWAQNSTWLVNMAFFTDLFFVLVLKMWNLRATLDFADLGQSYEIKSKQKNCQIKTWQKKFKDNKLVK